MYKQFVWLYQQFSETFSVRLPINTVLTSELMFLVCIYTLYSSKLPSITIVCQEYNWSFSPQHIATPVFIGGLLVWMCCGQVITFRLFSLILILSIYLFIYNLQIEFQFNESEHLTPIYWKRNLSGERSKFRTSFKLLKVGYLFFPLRDIKSYSVPKISNVYLIQIASDQVITNSKHRVCPCAR